MEGDRIELHNKLISIINSNNVYFQPPENIKLNYPCIVYFRNTYDLDNADNSIYLFNSSYEINYIYTDPDSSIPKKILSTFRYIRHSRPTYISNNRYHDSFILYY